MTRATPKLSDREWMLVRYSMTLAAIMLEDGAVAWRVGSTQKARTEDAARMRKLLDKLTKGNG